MVCIPHHERIRSRLQTHFILETPRAFRLTSCWTRLPLDPGRPTCEANRPGDHMATIVREARTTSQLFYVYMGVAFVAIAFGGFAPTFWGPIASGTFTADPVIHLHGALYSAWTLFFIWQAWLIAKGGRRDHRSWGMAGISLATAMVFSGVIAAINSMNVAEAMGVGDAGRRFSIVSLTAALLFGLSVTAAIASVRNTEAHKRWMIVATVPLMQAPVGRLLRPIFAADFAGPPPVFVTVPAALLVDLLILAAIAYDWRTRGRPHQVYLIGGALVVATQLLRVPVSNSDGWMRFATWVQGMGG